MTNIKQILARHTNRRDFYGIAGLLLALCLVGMGMESASAAETTTLVVTGDAAPDGNGTIAGFEPVLPLNASGKVAFIASLTGTQNPPTDGRGIFIADTTTVTQLVRTGQTAPDGNGTFRHFANNSGNFERLVLNDNATVAFTAGLDETSGGPTDNLGLFSANAGSGIEQLVRAGDTVPDGNGVFASEVPFSGGEPGLSPPGLDNNAVAYFYAFLNDTSGEEGVDDRGIFGSDGNSVTQLVRAGGAIPGESGTFGLIWPGIASNLNGQVALWASTNVEPPGESLDYIFVQTGNILKEVVRSSVPIPEGNGHLTSFRYFGIADNGNVWFQSYVAGSDDYRLDGERLFWTNGEALKQIARQGEEPPGEQVEEGKPPFRIEYFIGRDSNNQDKVAFSVTLERNLADPDCCSSGIYLGNGDATTRVLHQGDAVPGGNGTFGDVAKPLFLNNRGEIAFAAPLEGTSDPGNDDRGIFFIGSDKSVQVVARRGMPLAGSTILYVSFLGDIVDDFNNGALTSFDLSLAGLNAINDTGQVVYSAVLADGRSGIFLWKSTVVPPDEETIHADGFE